MTFYCSDEHWQIVKDRHTSLPCTDSIGGFSQCQLNQWLRENEAFSIQTSNDPDPVGPGPFRWFPAMIETLWTPLKDHHWFNLKGAYLTAMKPAATDMKDADVRFRAASEALSIPMTILYALEMLNEDISWTKNGTLHLHVSTHQHAFISFTRGDWQHRAGSRVFGIQSTQQRDVWIHSSCASGSPHLEGWLWIIYIHSSCNQPNCALSVDCLYWKWPWPTCYPIKTEGRKTRGHMQVSIFEIGLNHPNLT